MNAVHEARSHRSLLILVLSLVSAACTSGDDTLDAAQSVASTSPAASSSPDPFASLATPPPAEDAHLPPIQPIGSLGGDTIGVTHDADWVLVAYDVVWVSGLDGGMGRFDASTGEALPGTNIPQGPCGAADWGDGSVFTLTCRKPGVARIDPQGRQTGWISLDLSTNEGETSIGVGEGSVWALVSTDACTGCVLVELDPQRLKQVASYEIPEGASAVRAGLGGVWIVYSYRQAVLHFDPRSGEILAAIPTGASPRFFDVGEGGVWVMNQGEGSVTHIDASTDTVSATIRIDSYIEGGDLTVGEGSVWLRATYELVAQIDPATDRVVARYGKPEGSGSASAGSDNLWITAHDEGHLYRVPLTPASR